MAQIQNEEVKIVEGLDLTEKIIDQQKKETNY